ncbi:hypothetical protein [Clostridium felsineum]|uniref:Uncharacterized protein n=1 Tax=Clostridium felsineum TaxID=36839 RepID=A0A1S8KY85_9CLOT|nr:hypothetical protein [Clostridium felsineum]URZ05949.1 hypothetical protein CLROS_012810 [Clostridium felsineum]URZ10986.1 hypothetical protein CROST_017020 [Clostridium felsineum]
MTLTFYSGKTGRELEKYDKMTSIKCSELQQIKARIEREYRTKTIFIIK